MKEPGTIRMRHAVGLSPRAVAAYNDYYNRLAPWQDWHSEQPATIDWHEHHHLEFVADFVIPNGVSQSSGIFMGPAAGMPASHLVLCRPHGDRPFNGHDLDVLGCLQPHLRNLFRLQAKLADLAGRQLYAAELAHGCRVLSKREAEIAALLCQRLSAPEIATKLLISPHTVQRHIANIYEKLGVGSRRELMLKLLGDESSLSTHV